ncbi:MAG: hypothetical protein LBJ61_06315, partial [Deltaproteobacteria bacterium]|nr:hypothetical protein [Deltaproteobacteria bacterium]
MNPATNQTNSVLTTTNPAPSGLAKPSPGLSCLVPASPKLPLPAKPGRLSVRPTSLPAPLLVLATLLAVTLALACAGQARAQTPVKLGYTSPGGGAVIQAAIAEGYFAEENLAPELVAVTPDELAQKIAAGDLKAGEINHLGLKLAVDGSPLVFTAGLFSGFVEILALPSGPSELKAGDEFTLAVVDAGSGPAVAAARHFRTLNID